MTLDVEIAVALVTSLAAIVVAFVQTSKTQKNVDVQLALLDKQAIMNKDAIAKQLESHEKYVEKHEKEHKEILMKIENVREIAEGFSILVEQNKTLFKNQESTNEKVDKLVDSVSNLKDIIIQKRKED